MAKIINISSYLITSPEMQKIADMDKARAKKAIENYKRSLIKIKKAR